jgi:hypothetical protein
VLSSALVACSTPTNETSESAKGKASASGASEQADGDVPADAIPKTSTPRPGRGSDLVGLGSNDAARTSSQEDTGGEAAAAVDPALVKAAEAQLEIDAKARTAFGDSIGAAFLEGDLEAIGRWTRFGSRSLAKRCKDLESPREEELEARLAHCAKVIPWSKLDDATLTGGERKGPHAECDADIDGLSRIRMTLTSGTRRFHLDVLDPVADDQGILGFGGHITCSEVKARDAEAAPTDDAPAE